MNRTLIHLDNASTSWPKPESVYAAVDHYQRRLGAPAGRGEYPAAVEVARSIAKLRLDLAKFFGVCDPRRTVFAFNGTDAIHLALQGLLRPGDHVVTTVAEHNSVLRPLRDMSERLGISVEYANCNSVGVIDLNDLASKMRQGTRLVVATHVSNVSGAIQPVAEISEIARSHGSLTLIDGAQAAGHLDVSLTKIGCDAYATSGHKGLLGPLGTGVLFLSERAANEIRPVRCGGTGSQSQEDWQPRELPDRLESGNMNVPGLMGLAAGVEYLQRHGVGELRSHQQALALRLIAELSHLKGVRLLGPRASEERVGLVSLTLEAYDPLEAAGILSSSFGICCRAGLHCAPRMHEHFGTLQQGGALRVSFGFANTMSEVDALIDALREITTV